MKILYLDCYSGISGDMFLGALIDAGLDIGTLRRELAKLPVKGYKITRKKVRQSGIAAIKFDVLIDRKYADKERTLKDIVSMIRRSSLEKGVKDTACRIFESIASSEAKVHGSTSPIKESHGCIGLRRNSRSKRRCKDSTDELHFHEVGDIDSIVDIVGAAVAVKALGVERIYSSAPAMGNGGLITMRHGILPNPAPATVNLLMGLPIRSVDVPRELVTPTGAAILKELVDEFGAYPDMTLEGIGYGAGTHQGHDMPNCLRVFLGEAEKPFSEDRIVVIDATIDDMNPVDYEHMLERLFKAGALDAYLIPVHMKKTRPGILLTVLSKKEDLDSLTGIIFSESTTIGLRYYETSRKKLERESVTVKTRYGKVRVKISSGPRGIRKAMPEYEDCKRRANEKGVPISEIRREAERMVSTVDGK